MTRSLSLLIHEHDARFSILRLCTQVYRAAVKIGLPPRLARNEASAAAWYTADLGQEMSFAKSRKAQLPIAQRTFRYKVCADNANAITHHFSPHTLAPSKTQCDEPIGSHLQKGLVPGDC